MRRIVQTIMAVKREPNRYRGLDPFDSVAAKRAQLRLQDTAERIARSRIYACPVCEVVQHAIGFDNLESREKRMYLHHLKTEHGLEP